MNRFFVALVVLYLLLNCCNHFPEAEDENPSVLITYPNPTSQFFSVRVRNTSAQNYTLKIFDPSGGAILEAAIPSNHDQDFQVHAEDDGYYHVVLDMGNEVIIRKVVVTS